MKKYGLVVIGGGAAAFAAAIKANERGVKTAMINDGLPIGGTCVNVGCVPSKHLLEVGNHHYYPKYPVFKAIEPNGGNIDFDLAIGEKDEVIGELRKSNYINIVEGLEHVAFYESRGKFVSDREVQVNGEILKGEKFVVATGSRPTILPFEGIEEVDYITNREALSLDKLPESMIVIGGGPLGMEFAQMYHHFGTKVTILNRKPRILPKEEPEVSEEMKKLLEEEGIEIHVNAHSKKVWQKAGSKFVLADVQGEEVTFEAEELLLAAGVTPNSDGLGLENTGVEVDDKGFIVVDNEMHTTAPHIWAGGDVAGGLLLETTAAKEGFISASNALEGTHKTIDYDVVPHAVFTMPQVAGVGITEEELMRRKNVCSCRTVPMSMVPKARAIKDTRGLIKMVIDPETSVVVGVHIVSPLAADMIHEATLAVKHRLTIDDIIDTVHVFPTMSEAIKLVAQAFKRDITKMSCCVE